MARALIVGCGCRGRALGRALIDEGWVVRGTSRRDQGLEPIAEAGIEPQVADPDRIATVLDAIEGVALIYWLMGSAEGEPEAVADLHGPRAIAAEGAPIGRPLGHVVQHVSEDGERT